MGTAPVTMFMPCPECGGRGETNPAGLPYTGGTCPFCRGEIDVTLDAYEEWVERHGTGAVAWLADGYQPNQHPGGHGLHPDPPTPVPVFYGYDPEPF